MNTIARVLALLVSATILMGSVRSQSLLFQLPGQSAGGAFGKAVATAGDFDGDGFDDFLVGSPSSPSGIGSAEVVSGLKGTVLRAWSAAAIGESFGSAVAGVGDLDGDGLAEVAIAAPLGNGGNGAGSGVVRIYRASDGMLLRTHGGDSAGDHFGWSISDCGDLDGDGVTDMIVGAVDDDNQGSSSGSVRAFSGTTGVALYTVNGPSANLLFGYACTGLDDWDGDHVVDIAVGAPGTAALNQPGQVFVFSGASGAPLVTLTGVGNKDAFGISVDNAGDVDADGLSDLIVGAPQTNSHLRGYIRVFSPAGSALLFDIAGDSNDDRFGCAVAGAGDVNSDGKADLFVGASGDDDVGAECGSARILSGQSGLAIATIYGATAGALLGDALDGALDLNGDAIGDLVIGSSGDAVNGSNSGAAQAISGATLPLVAGAHIASLSASDIQDLALDAGSAHAGRPYTILGSTSGTLPGTPFGGLVVPLVRDRYFGYTTHLQIHGPIQNAHGVLDAAGQASAQFDANALPAPALWIGVTFYHAYVVDNGAGGTLLASNAVPVTIVP